MLGFKKREEGTWNMGQYHRKKTGEENDKLNMIRKSERLLQKKY